MNSRFRQQQQQRMGRGRPYIANGDDGFISFTNKFCCCCFCRSLLIKRKHHAPSFYCWPTEFDCVYVDWMRESSWSFFFFFFRQLCLKRRTKKSFGGYQKTTPAALLLHGAAMPLAQEEKGAENQLRE